VLKRVQGIILFTLLLCILIFCVLTAPLTSDAEDLPRHEPDLVNGELMFWVGGCASCHASPTSKLLLAGGKALNTAFGTFYVPNISTDPEFGIGDWSMSEFVNAMVNGVSPSNQHYYPAFPYTYYRKMYVEDVMDLRAFLDTLPASNNNSESHDLSFPYSFTRGIGLWKLLYSAPSKIQSNGLDFSPIQRGKYLVEGPGHCGACHTPRDIFGGSIKERHLAGARSLEVNLDSPDEKAEWNPNITPHTEGLASWSERDIAYFFETGFTPEFDTVGGSMVDVQENMAHIPAADLQAISSYLKSLSGIDKQE
jgi:mono/diheme cytochrome c family protein